MSQRLRFNARRRAPRLTASAASRLTRPQVEANAKSCERRRPCVGAEFSVQQSSVTERNLQLHGRRPCEANLSYSFALASFTLAVGGRSPLRRRYMAAAE